MEVSFVDKRHLHRRPSQGFRRVQTAETSADNNHSMILILHIALSKKEPSPGPGDGSS
jgi:hypothetical protein